MSSFDGIDSEGRVMELKTSRPGMLTEVNRDLIVIEYARGAQPSALARRWGLTSAQVMSMVNYKLTLKPWRFTRWGLPYTVNRGIQSKRVYYRRFANGWRMHEERGKFHRVLRRHGDQEAICYGFDLRTVQWEATVEYLREEFKGAPEANNYLGVSLYTNPGEWDTLRVWADRLDDLESPFGPKLRSLLPKGATNK